MTVDSTAILARCLKVATIVGYISSVCGSTVNATAIKAICLKVAAIVDSIFSI
jgi:hypothetical protein